MAWLPAMPMICMWKSKSSCVACVKSPASMHARMACALARSAARSSASMTRQASRAVKFSTAKRSWYTSCSECEVANFQAGEAAGGCCPPSSATYMPLPGRGMTRPVPCSVDSASRSEVRLMPSCSARSRCEGSSPPAA
ncbi:hypothetical protein D9M72_338510 [compost metagenome]